MKFGVNTFIWSAEFTRSDLPLIPRLKERGFDGLEVPLFRPDEFLAAEIRADAEAHDIECTVCSVFVDGLSLIADEGGVRRAARERLEGAVKATAEAGATLLCGPLYSPVGYLPGRRRTDDEWRRAVEAYQSLTPLLESYGVTLAIEPLNRFETFFLNTAADAALLCDQVNHSRVGVLFDTFHGNIEEKHQGSALRTVGRHLKHVHACENDRGIPGSGHVEWKGTFDALRDMEYEGYLTIESFGPRLGALSVAACIWRDIEPSVDAIAFEGLEFLKRGVGRA